ncbi:MAG TPA: LysE family transporter [Firmicutes bacterium]|jgi:threonine/homoserine/homoserine lactone efflux protein|nr:LysE family transporter [Bacillota bacterium]HOQ24166.1 LysE family transporter [Bacillota bacterium]
MGLAEIFFHAWGAGFSGAVMPGPLLAVDIRESYRRGAWAGSLLVLGHALLETVLVVGLVWGLDRWIRLEVTRGILGLLGGGLLLWMAWGMLRNGGKEGLELTASEDTAGGGMHPVLAGVVVSCSNPYWSLWWATIGLGMLVRAQEAGGFGVALFLVGHLLADFVWYSGISVVIAKGRQVIPTRFFRGLIVVCGVFLVYLAVTEFIPLGMNALGVTAWLRGLI